MAQKYTILKVIIQNFSRVNKASKGFTLIELIVGLSIMLIVGGLAMNALIQASTSFNKDKRSIDSSQNMSTILEMIGNDIKQSGENINDKNFPAVEFKIADATLDPTLMTGSSKIVVRRALTEPLTLCESIAANADPTARISIVVADNTPATVTASANCDVGTSSSKLVAARPSTEYELTATTDPVPTTSLATSDLILPRALRKVRDYRCQLDEPNPTVAYDDVSQATTTFCGAPTPSLEKIRIAVSNENGQFLIFNQTNETLGATAFTNTATSKKYSIAVNTTGLDTNAVDKNNKNKTVAYAIKSPIYVIEERVYTLTGTGDTLVGKGHLQVSINGAAPKTLVKKIENFRVSAKTYTNSADRIIQPTPTPAANICSNATPFADQPVVSTTAPISPSVDNPKYICQLNYFGTTGTADWKTLAGIKVEIQTKYDGTGQDSEHPTNPLLDSEQVKESKKKLYAASEFFPRNVLSK
jgi:prepilin-type N-terminal cleavage/methylation domain-containing protein